MLVVVDRSPYEERSAAGRPKVTSVARPGTPGSLVCSAVPPPCSQADAVPAIVLVVVSRASGYSGGEGMLTLCEWARDRRGGSGAAWRGRGSRRGASGVFGSGSRDAGGVVRVVREGKEGERR